MKKTLYSLMLSDEVIRAVDAAAHRMGTNRSSLVNQILADYVNLTTPERRITDIFQAIEELIAPEQTLLPFFAPNTQTMSLKSALEYKYRPTIKYEVELFRGQEAALGELTVQFRTQSEALIEDMTSFFRLWKQLEDRHLRPKLAVPPSYALYEGRFVRSIARPERTCTSDELARAISDYVKTFDALLKGYVSGSLTPQEAERRYLAQMSRETLLI